jgi:hypothetical protein
MAKNASFGEALKMFVSLTFFAIIIRVALLFCGVKHVPILDDVFMIFASFIPGLKPNTGDL